LTAVGWGGSCINKKELYKNEEIWIEQPLSNLIKVYTKRDEFPNVNYISINLTLLPKLEVYVNFKILYK
jgi:hypothetical protein